MPSDVEQIKVYKQITVLRITDLNPFLRLLAIRAFDLLVEARSNSFGFSNWEQVLEKLQDDGNKLSLSQFFSLLKHVRIGVLIAIFTAFSSVFIAGRAWSWWSTKPASLKRVSPSGKLGVYAHFPQETNWWTIPLEHYLEKIPSTSTNLTAVTIIVDANPFEQPMQPFHAEGNFTIGTNLSAFCYLIRRSNEVTSSVPVEVFCNENRFSASIPPAEAGDQLRFFLRSIVSRTPSSEQLANSVTLNAVPNN